MSTKKTLKDLFHHELKDLYSAENQLMKALPKMSKAATDEKLKKSFDDHLEETKGQVERLEKIGQILDMKLGGESCDAMKGLIKEGEGIISMDADEEVRDAGLIAAAQRVEHYEISGYGTARKFAEHLGFKEAEQLLAQTLKEEQDTDTKLNKLAISKVNKKAMV